MCIRDRPNVGIVVTNDYGQVLWARRVGQNTWQFPQGGIKRGESPLQAMYRELNEEVGLDASHVEVLASTKKWLRYRLPERYVRHDNKPLCIGQKQKWFLLRLIAEDSAIKIDLHNKPEFDDWSWVSYWYPLTQIVPFKREVYRRAMRELSPQIGRHIIDMGGTKPSYTEGSEKTC